MEMAEEEVVIVGAEVAGLATAVALKRVGVRALVLEKSEELRATGTALTLSRNAWLALDALGVSRKLASLYSPAKRIAIGPRSVHRKALLENLREELPNDTIRFSSKLAAVETQTRQGSTIAVIHLDDGTKIKAKILIGCDGVHSVVAQWLGLAAPVNSGRSAVRGLAVFPQGHGLNQEVRLLVHVGIRAGFVPLSDKDVYWFFASESLLEYGDKLEGNRELMQREVLTNYAKDLPPLFLDIVQHSDISTLTWAPLKFRHPWDIIFGKLSKGNVTVAGDAMHPMTPDLAQGGCAALEDAVVLGRHIGEVLMRDGRLVASNIPEAVDGYVKERKWRVTWLVTGSYLSWWAQLGGSNWWMKLLRDVVFYRFFIAKIVKPVHYDCGKLPSVGEVPSGSNE